MSLPNYVSGELVRTPNGKPDQLIVTAMHATTDAQNTRYFVRPHGRRKHTRYHPITVGARVNVHPTFERTVYPRAIGHGNAIRPSVFLCTLHGEFRVPTRDETEPCPHCGAPCERRARAEVRIPVDKHVLDAMSDTTRTTLAQITRAVIDALSRDPEQAPDILSAIKGATP